MALPPWTIELLRRGLTDVAARARQPETLEKLKTQASEILQDLPESAARNINAGIETASKQIDKLVRTAAENGSESVRRWTDRYTATSVPCLNATGVLLSPDGPFPPVGDAIVAAGIEHLQGGRLSVKGAAARSSQKLADACGCVDGVTVAATNNFAGAVTAVSLLGIRHPLLVPRSSAIRVADRPLPEILSSVLPVVEEIGDADGWRIEDVRRDGPAFVVQADGGRQAIDTSIELPAETHRVAILSAAVIGESPIEHLPSAMMLLSEGCDLVVLPGNGLIGGPESGLLIGSTKLLGLITGESMWLALAADEVKVQMLCRAIETLSAPDLETHPTLSMMTTSIDNLRGRAERIATRLTGESESVSTQITDGPAHLIANSRWQIESRQVRVAKSGVSPKELTVNMASRNPAVLITHDDEAAIIDLRFVSPDQDSLIKLS